MIGTVGYALDEASYGRSTTVVARPSSACLMPPRPMLACKSSDGTPANQTCTDEGPLTLERSKTVECSSPPNIRQI
jgi:hypothetical protein